MILVICFVKVSLGLIIWSPKVKGLPTDIKKKKMYFFQLRH